MKIEDTKCQGVKLIHCFSSHDARGGFTKIYHEPDYLAAGLDVRVRESYYSSSGRDVIRGMHFQLPPYDHAKIVHVIKGEVEDVVLDLRKNSQTYGQAFSFLLSGDDPKALYIPAGFAHGFKSMQDHTLMLYQVTSAYEQSSDTGILYDSFGYDWKTASPVVSDRDKSFMKFEEFESPF